ncbi:MAG TPA: SCE4755 family polysaccharide monooxygenase-like protein [Anaeromyxobacter sp.]
MSRALSTALAAFLLLGALPARAHVRLVSPVSRYGDEMKLGPCGRLGGARTDLVTTVRPGQSLEVVFDEIIDHPGYYRIAFDASGDDDLAPPVWNGASWENPPNVTVLADHLPDSMLTHGDVSVVLPDVECDACTLQLIEVMTDKPPYDGLDDFYFQCADLVLSRTLPVGGPPPRSFGPARGGGRMGGCAAHGAESSAPALLLAVALLVLRRRPRGRGNHPGPRGTLCEACAPVRR